MLLNGTTIIFKQHKIPKPLSVFKFCVLYFIFKIDTTVWTISVRSELQVPNIERVHLPHYIWPN